VAHNSHYGDITGKKTPDTTGMVALEIGRNLVPSFDQAERKEENDEK
jgi:hypothetical protein